MRTVLNPNLTPEDEGFGHRKGNMDEPLIVSSGGREREGDGDG